MKELRIGLVLYGGVSLAIYINGVTSEIWHALRASQAHHGGDVSTLSSTAALYQRLITEAAQAGGQNVRIVVDTIAGASAGGVNGVALGKAIVEGGDYTALNGVWISQADIKKLRADPPKRASIFVRAATAVVSPWFRSIEEWFRNHSMVPKDWLRDHLLYFFRGKDATETPLDGRYFAEMIARTLDTINKQGNATPLLPNRASFDLFLTVSDLYGWPRHLPVSLTFHPQALFEDVHAHSLHFHRRPHGVLDDDFGLTYAGRSTASFPIAFAPFNFTAAENAFAAGRPGMPAPVAGDFARKHLREHQLFGINPSQVWMIDGGLFDNKPFGHVARAIERKPADYEVERVVIYVEPDPADEKEIIRDAPPLPREIALKLFGLFRHEPINEDLRALDARNAAVSRFYEAQQANRSTVERVLQKADKDLPWPPHMEDIDRWRVAIYDEIAWNDIPGYPGYVALKVRRAMESFAGLICRALDYPYHSRQAWVVRNAVRIWYAQSLPALERDAERPHALDDRRRQLLDMFDRGYRQRRLRHLTQMANTFYREDSDRRGMLDGFKQQLAEIHTTFDTLFDDNASILGSVVEGVEPLNEDAITEAMRAFRTGTLPDDIRAELERLLERLAEPLRAEAHSLNNRLREAIAGLEDPVRERILIEYLTFVLTDMNQFPQMDAAGIEDLVRVDVMRISPRDRTFLPYSDEDALKGREMGAFAGFLKRAYREHDLLWGRLDGAERMVELILATAFGRTNTPAAENLRKHYTREIFNAILSEESQREDTSVGALAALLKLRIA